MASSVSSVVGVDRCCIVGDMSLVSIVDGVCTFPTEGSRMALIMFVCGVSESVLAVALIIVTLLKVGDVGDDMSYFIG